MLLPLVLDGDVLSETNKDICKALLQYAGYVRLYLVSCRFAESMYSEESIIPKSNYWHFGEYFPMLFYGPNSNRRLKMSAHSTESHFNLPSALGGDLVFITVTSGCVYTTPRHVV